MRLDRTKTCAALGLLGAASLLLLGCSSTASGAAPADDAAQQQEAGPGTGADQGPRGVSGSIAVVQDGLLQVQDSDSQTAVAYDDDTTITQQVSASLADVATGVCITGVSDVSGGEGSEALTTVMITDAVGGECSPGFGGMRGGANPGQEGAPDGAAPPEGGEMPGGMPEDMPERPDGAAGGGFGGLSSGLVTAVAGTTITIEAASMDGTTAEQEVSVDDATVFTRTEAATSEALAAGVCVVAMGEYAGEQYAASSLALSEAGDEGCTSGFGGRGMPGRGGDDA